MDMQEILNKWYLTPKYFSNDHITEPLVFDCMVDYARQTSLHFAKWVNENYLYHQDGLWYKSEIPEWGSKTDEEVWALYLNRHNNSNPW